MKETVVRVAEGNYHDLLAHLEQLVNIDSGSGFAEGIRQVMDYLVSLLTRLGCAVAIENKDSDAPVLVARKTGSGTRKFLLLAHIDTVFPVGTARQRSFRIEGGRAYGPGVTDCKGGTLGQVYVLKTLLESGFDGFGEIILVFNSDEEVGTAASKDLINHIARECDVAMIFESPSHPDEFIISRAGTMNYRIQVTGRAAHSGVSPEEGRNAIVELMAKLGRIQELQTMDGIHLNIARISGGTKTGTVPDYAECDFDLRVDTWESAEKAETFLKGVAQEQKKEGVACVITGGISHPPFERQPQIEPLIDLLKGCGEQLGLPLKAVHCGGASDASFTAEVGTPTLCGLAPVGNLYHTEEEFLDLSTVVPRISLNALFIIEVCRQGTQGVE